MKTSFELHEAIKSRVIFPEAIILPCELISKKGFFPVCTGTFDGSDDLSDKRIMIVGQDFGKVGDAEKARVNGEDFGKVSTWKQMLPMLEKLGIHEKDCFFTNYLMGIRNSKSNMGPSPGLISKDYLESCLRFFEHQVDYIRPELILFLGKVAYYLSQLGVNVKTKLGEPYLQKIRDGISANQKHEKKIGELVIPCYYLIHPSQRELNKKKELWSDGDETALGKTLRSV